MRVDVFPTLDEAGKDLVTILRRDLAAVVPDLDLRVVKVPGPAPLIASVMRADATVLDLTPSADGVHRYTTMNYPWLQDQVLVVARGYLPVNVAPRRRGGAAVYPGRRTNDEIAAWIRAQLTGPLAGQRRGLGRRLLDVVLPAAGRAAAAGDPWSEADVFVSYRGADLAAATRLRDELRAGVHHGGRAQRVVMFGPGELAHPSAVLAPMLRWNVLSVISDIVRHCREMWIVDSPEYLGSWWTQGELVCRTYFGDTVELRTCSTTTGRVGSVPDGYTASLSEEQRRQMARLFANSHPDEMAPESTVAMRRLRPTGLPLAADEVFTEESWTVPLLQCPRCSLPDGVPRSLDPAAFLDNKGPILRRVALDVLAECARTGTHLACPGECGQRFTVDVLDPAYLFHQLPTGPGGSFLEQIPIYRATVSPSDGAPRGPAAG